MDGPPPPEQDFSTLSVTDRLAHKNWKARVSGYESLLKAFQLTTSDSDPAFNPYLNNPDILKRIVTDANAVAQEKGVEAVITFVKFAGENASRTCESVAPAVVEKCLGSSRNGTKTQAIELLLQYVEVQNSGADVVSDVLLGLSAKQPKTVAGCVTALKEIVSGFGTQTVPPPPILKALPRIFAHTDKTVRAEGNQLAHSIYRCIGRAIDPWLADLKSVQVKELQDNFERMDKEGIGHGTFRPTRLTRKRQRQADEAIIGGEEQTTAEEVAEEKSLDPRASAEPVDISSSLPAGFHTNATSSKWKERKEALDDLLAVLTKTLRIKDAPELSEVVKDLSGRMTDANINCVIAAANCLDALAKGMGSSFDRFKDTTVSNMLERLKERKQTVTDAIGQALDSIFATTTLSDMLPLIQPALTSKNPQVKEGTLKFLVRCLASTKMLPQPVQIKPLADALATLLEDSHGGARDEAAIALGTLMKITGERALNPVIDGLVDVRKVKVKEAFDKATVKCKAGGGLAPNKSAPTASQPLAKSASAAKKPVPSEAVAQPQQTIKTVSTGLPAATESSPPEVPATATRKGPPARLLARRTAAGDPSSDAEPPSKGPSARLPAKKPPAPATTAVVHASSKSKPTTAPSGALDTFKYKHTPEDSESLVAELIPDTIVTAIGDPNWKARLAALDDMTSLVEEKVPEIDSEVLVRFLMKKGATEKNFQVSSKLYTILSILAERCSSFGRSSAALSVPHLVEKLGDMKLKKPAGDTLMIYAEKTSLSFVLTHAYEPLSKQKAPKVLADALTWVNQALTEFGISGLSLKNLIELLKAALRNSNAAVRNNATTALVTVKIFAGPSIKDLLEDLNPQLLATIHSEFDKVDGQPAPEPSRRQADLMALAQTSPGVLTKKAPTADPLDDLFPRIEFDGLLKGTTILADAKSDAWKSRKEALETLQALLDLGGNKRLKPGMGEIGQVLKARITDANKAVQLLALDVVARVATGMNKPFEKQTRFFTLPVATVLSDQKANIRQAAMQTLTAMANACEGLESMIHGLTAALESSNPLQKSSLLQWITDWLSANEPRSTLDIKDWAGPVVTSLDDRNTDVRKAAQAILPIIVKLAGYDHVLQQCSTLKPASRATAMPLIQAARVDQPEPPVSQQPIRTSTKESVREASVPPPQQSGGESAVPVVQPAPASSSKLSFGKVPQSRRKLPVVSSAAEQPLDTASENATSRMAPRSLLGGLRKPGQLPPTVKEQNIPESVSPSVSTPFTSTNFEAKRSRLAKDGARWINESGPSRKDLMELLQLQMQPTATKTLLDQLFSHDHSAVEEHITGLSILCELYSSDPDEDNVYGLPTKDVRDICIANSDLAFKYISVKAHEPQPNLGLKCLDLLDRVLGVLRLADYQLTDNEALCFVPTIIYKLGDAREVVRLRVQSIVQTLPKVFAISRLVQLLIEHGLRSKVAKARQGSLEELGAIIKRVGLTAFEPSKAFPAIAAMISDKDAQVRKSALATLGDVYTLTGDDIWSLIGQLTPKDKTQLEERLRRVTLTGSPAKNTSALPAPVSRLASNVARPASPSFAPMNRARMTPRPVSPAVAGPSKRPPDSPTRMEIRPASPAHPSQGRPAVASRISRLPTGNTNSAVPSSSAENVRPPTSHLPSRLGQLRTQSKASKAPPAPHSPLETDSVPPLSRMNGHTITGPSHHESANQDISVILSNILSSDSTRSVDALKKIQKIFETPQQEAANSPAYQQLADYVEGMVETVVLQISHVFDRGSLGTPANFRLAKHLIQTLNALCDHSYLAESLSVPVLTQLLEELTSRLLQTDENPETPGKDLSRFINMIILRIFATARRMTVFRSLLSLLLQIMKPFPTNNTQPDSRDAKVAELVLKCVWKLARNIPADLEKQALEPVELFPAIEAFLQSVPPNEWRARASNKIPGGDMPLRTVKVVIQHIVAHYGIETYDILSSAFDDPSATIVYPYVFRILNSSSRAATDEVEESVGTPSEGLNGTSSNDQFPDRPVTPPAIPSTSSARDVRHSSPSQRTSRSVSSMIGVSNATSAEEPDPDAELLKIIGHISSDTTGAMHKEGITELHQFLKAYPHKKSRVDKMLESTGPAFRKYIARALASRAADDEDRDTAVATTLSKLEANQVGEVAPLSPELLPSSPRRTSAGSLISPSVGNDAQEKLSRLHDIFQYSRNTRPASSEA